jgi:hypothetical protein
LTGKCRLGCAGAAAASLAASRTVGTRRNHVAIGIGCRSTRRTPSSRPNNRWRTQRSRVPQRIVPRSFPDSCRCIRRWQSLCTRPRTRLGVAQHSSLRPLEACTGMCSSPQGQRLRTPPRPSN